MMDIDTYRTPRRQPPSRFFPLEAEELLRGGEVENATELCKRGLIYFPENISGYAVLAQAYMLLGQDERAMNVLEGGYRRTGAEGLQTLRRMMAGENLPALMGFNAQPVEPEKASEQSTALAIEENVEEIAPPEAVAPQIEEDTTPTEAWTEVELPDPVEAAESQGEVEQTEVSEEKSALEIEADATEAETIETAVAKESTLVESEETVVEEDITVEDAVAEDVVAEDAVEEAILEEKAVAEDIAVEDVAEVEAIAQSTPPETNEIETVGEEVTTAESEDLAEVEPDVEQEESLSEFSISEETESVTTTADQEAPTPEIAVEDIEETETFSITLEENAQAEAAPKVEPEQEAATTQLESQQEQKAESPEAGTKKNEEKEAAKYFRQGGLSLHSGTKISRLSSSNLRLIPGLEFAPLRRDDDLKIRIAPLVSEELSDVKVTFDSIIPGIPSEVSERQPSTPPLPEASVSDPDVADVEDIKVEDEPIAESRSFHATDSDRESVEEEESVDLFPEIPVPDTPEIEAQPNSTQREVILPLHIAQSGQGHHGAMTPLEELARRLETARIPIVEEEEDDTYDSPAFEPSIVSDTFAAILVGQRAYAEAIKAYQMLARMKPERREEYDKKIAEIRWKMSSV